MYIKPRSSKNLEQENVNDNNNNREKIKFICDNIILLITEIEFLLEYSNKNIKKFEDLYEIENLPSIISEKDIFGVNLNNESFETCIKKDFVVDEHQLNKNENNVDVMKLIKYFTGMFETKINLLGKKITFFNDIQSSFPDIILFDEKKLKKIMFNLLSNALKFSSYGKIGVMLDYNKESKNLVFHIIDNGKGIGLDDLQKIGEPYFKTNCNNNDYGIGMGIFLVKKLVKSLNGEFSIKSELNK